MRGLGVSIMVSTQPLAWKAASLIEKETLKKRISNVEGKMEQGKMVAWSRMDLKKAHKKASNYFLLKIVQTSPLIFSKC
jgi:hypothetical protein